MLLLYNVNVNNNTHLLVREEKDLDLMQPQRGLHYHEPYQSNVSMWNLVCENRCRLVRCCSSYILDSVTSEERCSPVRCGYILVSMWSLISEKRCSPAWCGYTLVSTWSVTSEKRCSLPQCSCIFKFNM